jgi:hypothetical protein
MKITKQIDLGEYIINVEYDDNGSGYLKVTILDELGDEIEFIEVSDENDDEDKTDCKNDINPNLN